MSSTSGTCADPCVHGSIFDGANPDQPYSYCQVLHACAGLRQVGNLSSLAAVPHHLNIADGLLMDNCGPECDCCELMCHFGCVASLEVALARAHIARAVELLGPQLARHHKRLGALTERLSTKPRRCGKRAPTRPPSDAGNNSWRAWEAEAATDSPGFRLDRLVTRAYDGWFDGRTAAIGLYRPEGEVFRRANAAFLQATHSLVRRAKREGIFDMHSPGSTQGGHNLFWWQVNEAQSLSTFECEHGTAAASEIRGSPAFQWLSHKLVCSQIRTADPTIHDPMSDDPTIR